MQREKDEVDSKVVELMELLESRNESELFWLLIQIFSYKLRGNERARYIHDADIYRNVANNIADETSAAYQHMMRCRAERLHCAEQIEGSLAKQHERLCANLDKAIERRRG